MPRWTAEQWFIVLAIAFVAVFEARHLLGRGARLAARAFRPSGRGCPSVSSTRASAIREDAGAAVRSDPLGEEGDASAVAPMAPSSPSGRRHGGPEKVPGSAKSAAARSTLAPGVGEPAITSSGIGMAPEDDAPVLRAESVLVHPARSRRTFDWDDAA